MGLGGRVGDRELDGRPIKEEIGREVAKRTLSVTPLVFPEDLDTNISMLFRVFKYSYQRSVVNPSSLTSSEDELAYVTLPLPSNLVDETNVNVAENQLGFIGGAVASTVSAGQSLSPERIRELTKQFTGNLISGSLSVDIGSVTSRVLRYAVESVLPSAGSAIDVATGNILSPQTVAAYEGISLKQHTFTWRLAPRNYNESQKIKNIINVLKSASLPSYAAGTGKTIQEYPSLILPQFGPGLDSSFLYDFRPCLIQSVNVNYSPTEEIALIHNGVKAYPAFVDLSISLLETTIRAKNNTSELGVGLDEIGKAIESVTSISDLGTGAP